MATQPFKMNLEPGHFINLRVLLGSDLGIRPAITIRGLTWASICQPPCHLLVALNREIPDAQRSAIEFCWKISRKLCMAARRTVEGRGVETMRGLATILIYRVWTKSKGEIRIEGRIPQLEVGFE